MSSSREEQRGSGQASSGPRPKVTLLFETFPNVSEPYLLSVVEALVKNDMLRAVFATRPGHTPKGRKLNISGALQRKIRYLPLSPVLYFPKFLFIRDIIRGLVLNPRGFASLLRAVKKLHPSKSNRLFCFGRLLPMAPYFNGIVHIMASTPTRAFPELFEIDGLKLICTFRGYDMAVRPQFSPEWVDYLRDVIFKKATRLHFVSQFLRERGESVGAPPEKCVVLRQSTSSIFFGVEREVEGPVPLLVSVGRLVWIKGFEYSIEAVRILKMRGRKLRYVILGDGELMPQLTFLISHRGLENEVELQGPVPSEQVRDFLAKASVFICPSVSPSESLGRQLMEAQAVGVPIVASNVGGITVCVEDGKTAFCVPPFEPEALADRIEQLLDDPDLAKQMGDAGRERAGRLFRVEGEISDWVELYQNVLQETAER